MSPKAPVTRRNCTDGRVMSESIKRIEQAATIAVRDTFDRPIQDLRIFGSGSKADEVRLEVTFIVVRLHGLQSQEEQV